MAPKTRTRRQGEAKGRAVARLANGQHGVVGRWQLLELGLGAGEIKRWVRSGRLTPLHREAFAFGHTALGRNGRWHAAVLACGEEAVLSHRSAAVLWGLARDWRGGVDVTAPSGRQFRPGRLGIRLHRCRFHEPGERVRRVGIPVTSVARTLFDFAEAVDFEHLENAWEEAGRLKLLRLSKIERVCEHGYGRRALRPTRRLLVEARAAETVRSPLEERFRAFCRAAEIPAPATNVHVLGHEVDCLWPRSTHGQTRRLCLPSPPHCDVQPPRTLAMPQRGRSGVERLQLFCFRASSDGPGRPTKKLSETPDWPRRGTARSRAGFRRRWPPSRSGFRRPARPWPRALPSSPGRCPRSRR
jgi:hypothetical protein